MDAFSLPPKLRISALTALLGIGGWIALGFSQHRGVISTIVAFVGGLLWTALVGVTAGIWNRIERTVVELLGDAIDVHIRNFISGYRKRYFQHVLKRYGNFDVKGLVTQGPFSLDIENVYVDLAVVPQTASKASTQPLTTLSAKVDKRELWDFLRSSREKRTQSFAILGPPGSGKTTLLKHISLQLARHGGKYRDKKLIPVLLFVREHAPSIVANPDLTIIEIANAAVTRMGIPSPAGWFQKNIDRGCCLILLDGLDEVADPRARKLIAEWVDRQMEAFDSNPFLVTSRPFGYRSNPLARATVLEICPFSLEQTKRFVSQWYLANEVMSAGKPKDDQGVSIRAKEGADDLLTRLAAHPAWRS